jgi:glyoxylase-like metal-dependent hydrolase (beta-lactamase superfamily II)
MQIDVVVVGPLEVNCYLVKGDATGEGIIIDPGADAGLIERRIDNLGLIPRAIFLTHGHGDHIAAVKPLKEKYSIPLYIGKGDEPLLISPSANLSELLGTDIVCPSPDHILVDGDLVEIGGTKFAVLSTPGHTRGGVCFLAGKALFCGDTLFWGSIGRTDLPGGDYAQLIASIKKKILSFPDDVVCYPGHGPETTVGFERKNNPYLLNEDSV